MAVPNPWDNDEIIAPAPTGAARPQAAQRNPWDDDEIVDEGPGLDIDITIPAGQLTQAEQAEYARKEQLARSTGVPLASLLSANERAWRQSQNSSRADTDTQNLADAQRGIANQEAWGRLFGLGGRDILEGLAAIPDIAISPATKLANKVLPEQYQQHDLRGAIGAGLDAGGVPRPETPQERVLSNVNQSLVGTVTGVGLGNTLSRSGNRVASGVGNTLTSSPGLQATGAVTGATAAGLTREAGYGPGAQLAAALLGGMAPGLVASGGAAATRGAMRGPTVAEVRTQGLGNAIEARRQQVGQTIDDFRALGAQPSVGQATQGPVAQGLEGLLSKGPTSSGVMSRFGQRQAAGMGDALTGFAEQLFRGASGERAGREITRGISGPGGFVDRTRQTSNALYDELGKQIPADTRIGVGNVRSELADLNAAIPGAPSVSRFFQNARLQGIESGLKDDAEGLAAVLSRPGVQQQADDFRTNLLNQANARRTALTTEANAAEEANRQQALLGQKYPQAVPTAADIERRIARELGGSEANSAKDVIESQVEQFLKAQVDGKLPYEAVTKLRTLVGQELEGSTLMSDVPRSKWKSVYAALTRDMEAAATTPEAKQALSRANAYYKARMDRLESLEAVIDKNGGPEKVFTAAMSGTRDGATTLRAVMQSLPKQGQEALTAAFIRRLGLANPGAQNAAGDAFNPSTFLTNWNKVSPEARKALFDRHGPRFVQDMDRIARVADNIKSGAEVYRNPSGTAAPLTAWTYWLGMLTMLGSGQKTAAGVTAAGGVAGNLSARQMTNPKFVDWLLRTTQGPRYSPVAQLQELQRIGIEENDPDLIQVADALQSAQEQYGEPDD